MTDRHAPTPERKEQVRHAARKFYYKKRGMKLLDDGKILGRSYARLCKDYGVRNKKEEMKNDTG